jgi:hypothetical protein
VFYGSFGLETTFSQRNSWVYRKTESTPIQT